MKRLLISTAAMIAALGVGTVAQAAPPAAAISTNAGSTPYINLDLGGTATYGNTGIIGSFSDTYTFYYPVASDVVASLTSAAISLASRNIVFSSLTFNGQAFDLGTTGRFENWTYEGPLFTGNTPNVMTFSGNVVGGPASYAGTLEFSAAAVPGPEAWALMIAGAGVIGVSARLRRRKPAGARTVEGALA